MYKILAYFIFKIKCQESQLSPFSFEVVLTTEPEQLPTCMLSNYVYSGSGVLSHLYNNSSTHIVLMGNNVGFLKVEQNQITYTTIEIKDTAEEVRILKIFGKQDTYNN